MSRENARICKSSNEGRTGKAEGGPASGHRHAVSARACVSGMDPRRYRALFVALLSSAAGFMPGVASANDLTDLGTLNGGSEATPNAISADGTTITGFAKDGGAGNADRAFRWTQTSGMTSLGTLNNGNASYGYGVNADGSVIVGVSYDGSVGNALRAFRWTQAGGMVSLGTLNGGSESRAWGVNADGSVIVGAANDGNEGDASRAFRWTQAGGMVSLGTFNGGFESTATAVNADGSVVVGGADDGTNNHAFRWTQAGGMIDLGVLPGDIESTATGVSADGAVVVGFSADNQALPSAFRWTQADGIENIGTLAGGSTAQARGVNANGSVIVGFADDGTANHGFRWTAEDGMVKVDDWLRENGVSLPHDETLAAFGVSADGNIVTGVLTNEHVFIARGPSDITPEAGMIDADNYVLSITNTPRASTPLQNADLAVNGAHSSPLFMLLDPGQSSAWFTGDGGYASTTTAQGGLGAGEFGFGRGLEDGWTVRLAGGGQYSRLDTQNGGNATFSSGYLAPDVSRVFGNNLVATLSGYFSWGKADIRRGYLNGAANDSSFGSAATQAFGFRARLDWRDAFSVATTAFSPFVSYTYLNSHMNGYTETGGSFPVRFDGSREISNAIRIGADATTPLNEQFALVTRLEYGHRFERTAAGVSGEVLGLTDFSIDGPAVKQDWVRAGIGVSYKLGQGDGLVMVNTSNQTGKNTTWLSASYRVKF